MLRRATTVAVLGLALVLASVPPAAAARVVERDGTGDVWRYPVDGSAPVPAPEAGAGDVKRLVLRHGRRSVVVTQQFVSLRRVRPLASYRVELRTPRGAYREVVVDASRRNRWKGTARVFTRNGARVRCGVRHRLDYGRARVVIRVDRACLQKPSLVKVRSHSLWVSPDDDLMVDNPHTAGARVDRWTPWVGVG